MPAARREPMGELFRTVAEAMMSIVGWLLWLMPVAVFSLAFGMSAAVGAEAVTVIATWVVLLCSILCVFVLLQYPIAAVFGRVSMRRFAAAVFPAQILAVGTRSSIATLPLLLERGRDHLGLRGEVTSVVMPLAVSTFKINRAITSPLQFLFLAHVYSVDLSMVQILTFTALAILLSFTTVGIPSGGSLMRSAPLYVAAGIPIQGYLLIEAAEAIPDIFKTLLNVTGNMTAAAIVNRWTAPASLPAGVPDVAPGGIAAGV
jgi:Na+/H+-dicarboxylate symporter